MSTYQINPLFLARMKLREIERLNAKWPRWVPLWGKRILDMLESYYVYMADRAIDKIFVYVVRPLWNRFFARRLWVKQTLNPEPEMSALRFLRKCTNIPVPRPWFSFRDGSASYIIMDRVPGETLEKVLLDSTDKERASYMAQLASILADMRALKSPYGPRICSAIGGHVAVKSIPSPRRVGPFATEGDFNKASLEHMWPVSARADNPLPAPSTFCHDVLHPIVFTHGDLAPRNIMVRGGRITAIIDWETAGWFPAHWEFVETHVSNGEWRREPCSDIFRSHIPQIVPSYQRELDVRLKWGGF